MDFGEILKKWEHGQTRNSKKPAMDEWLKDNEIFDKDTQNELNTKNYMSSAENRRRKMKLRPDAVLDIHGLTSEEAWLALETFFENAKENNYEKLRIIHGKGNHTMTEYSHNKSGIALSQGESILRATVRKFIEQCKFAGESGCEKSINGGSGATWVLLKKPQ